MNVTGKIIKLNQTEAVSEKFSKRDIVVETNEQYPQKLLIQFAQSNCSKLDNYKVGQLVTIGVNLKGREWTNQQGETKYFNTIEGWNIKEGQLELADVKIQEPIQQVQSNDESNETDLPF